jgi:hypothetical protein
MIEDIMCNVHLRITEFFTYIWSVSFEYSLYLFQNTDFVIILSLRSETHGSQLFNNN